MTLIILLFAVGILLIATEVIVPGAILGTIGGLMMAGGSVLAFFEFGTGGGLIALAIAAAVGALALFIEFRILPRTALGRRAFLTEEVTGVSAAFGKDALSLVGKPAEALTMLSPSGYVRIDGRRYEAFCQSGQAPAGAALEVIGADSFRLIVTQRLPSIP
ncbi:MAG: serine protease [Verrucomicrobiaceae bacterium]|nr:MAG: serine protease [Verrucomicrobiaceae bacterium]